MTARHFIAQGFHYLDIRDVNHKLIIIISLGVVMNVSIVLIDWK